MKRLDDPNRVNDRQPTVSASLPSVSSHPPEATDSAQEFTPTLPASFSQIVSGSQTESSAQTTSGTPELVAPELAAPVLVAPVLYEPEEGMSASSVPDRSGAEPNTQRTRESVEPTAEPAGRSAGSRAVHRLTWSLTVLGFLLVLVSGLPLLVEEIQYRLERGRQRAQVEIATAALGDMNLADISLAYQMVSQRVGPSVVHINIVEGQRESDEEGEAEPETELPRRLRRRFDSGQGSGVVIDPEGYIVTNRHVIEEARHIEVVLSDGRRRPAKVIGLDDPTDLAVLKVDATGLIAAEWGDSESLDVGALVWAVGSPFGLERSITFGILSAKNRAGVAGTPFQNLMQTDAAVNPGNSGGPLVDVQGRVIGINTAIVGPSYQGVSFAIPSRVARRVYQDLKTRGEVTRGWLGVEPQSIDEETALQHSLTERKGAFVRRLADGPFGEKSPARAAGIEPGDIILKWNGGEVDSAGGLIARVSQTPVGETVPVVVLRAGATLTLEITVGNRPANLE